MIPVHQVVGKNICRDSKIRHLGDVPAAPGGYRESMTRRATSRKDAGPLPAKGTPRVEHHSTRNLCNRLRR